MNVLVINCGSSSLKFQLINSESEKVLAKDFARESELMEALHTSQQAVRRLNLTKLCLHIQRLFSFVIDALTDAETGVVKSLDEIGAVGHRVVHGGRSLQALL